MTSLRSAGLGPIVGATTDTSARIWVRADPKLDDKITLDSETRTIGVLAVLREDGRRLRSPNCYYFRLRREFDRSGILTVGRDAGTNPLKPETDYEFRVGVLVLDDPIDDGEGIGWERLQKKLPPAKSWLEDLEELPEQASVARFRTFPPTEQAAGKLDFLLGSCRYPGLFWKTRHADRIFGPMADLSEAVDRPSFALMVGDQVYADRMNALPIGKADTYEEFRDRYLDAFSSRNIRRLMRQLPTYMILDDHEIEDNWTQDKIRRNASHNVFNLAIDAYLSYQWSHGPRTFGKRLYYAFDCAGFPFFVLDTRTQRYLEGEEGDLTDNHLLGRPTLPGSPPGQLLRLLNWLKEQQAVRGNVPKFIVTSSVFVPNPMSARHGNPAKGKKGASDREKERSDSWPGFPLTRGAILQCIVDNGIQNVVFLAGDIHCSNVAAMDFEGPAGVRGLKAYSVTSSAFYWPFCFADGEPSDFVHDSRAEGQEDGFPFHNANGDEVVMHYKAWNFTQEDNFCRVTVDAGSHCLEVRAFNKDGRLVEEEDDKGNLYRLDAKLQLAPW